MSDLMSPRASSKTGRKTGLKGFWRDRRGVSAVEFALIAPILIAFYCGLAELSQAMMAQRRIGNVASSIGDLVAQNAQLTTTRKNDVFTIGGLIMAPFPTTTLRMCLLSVTSDATGKDTVDWAEPYNGHTDCPAAGTVLGSTVIPTGVLPASQSVIVAKATYAYASPIKLVLPSTINFTRTYYLRPRKSETVLRVTG